MLTDILNRFATGTYTVTRTGATSYVNGRRQDPTPTTFTISGVVQPLTGRDEDNLPEGLLASEMRVLYTATALQTSSGQEPDKISVDGEDYTVINSMKYTGFGQTYYRCLISLYQIPQL